MWCLCVYASRCLLVGWHIVTHLQSLLSSSQPDGSILGYYGNAFLPNRGKGQRGNLRVPRQVLRKLMLDRVNKSSCCKVHWGEKLVSFQQTPNKETILQVTFEDGTVIDNVDLLVGADGIKSTVVKTLVGASDHASTGLRPLGVMVILGIANYCHAHLDERGFYTLDGTCRLFTMPYQGSKLDDEQNGGTTRRRIMWQLSFREDNKAEAQRLSVAGPQVLRDEVLKRCSQWHEPVVEMVNATPLDTVWGTSLMDRDPQELLQRLDLRSSSSPPRVVVLGDAVHSMSPFKGQGANQALTDGPLLASWLQNASIDSAVRSFWREMVQRTAKVVAASRQAAVMLHSPECLESIQDFAGVKPEHIGDLLHVLNQRGIGASKGGQLDQLVQETIDELGYSERKTDKEKVNSLEYTQLCSQALALASAGDVHGLRNLSLLSSEAICNARGDVNRSCLHMAVLGGHYNTCRWLLTEAGVPMDHYDDHNRTAMDHAYDNGREDIRELMICIKTGREHVRVRQSET